MLILLLILLQYNAIYITTIYCNAYITTMLIVTIVTIVFFNKS